MAISTYAELKTAVNDFGKRGDATAKVDTFIDLCESDIWANLRIKEMQTRATGNLSGRTLALPTGFLEMRKLRLTATPYELEYVSPESMIIQSSSGRPTQYTVTDQIEFNKTPDSTYAYEILHYRSLTALSASQTTSDVLTRYPSIYLYGTLKHYFDWCRLDDQAMKYEAKFMDAINKANRNEKRGQYPSGKAMKSERPTP